MKEMPTLLAVLAFILCFFIILLRTLFLIIIVGLLIWFIVFMFKTARMFYKVEIKKEIYPEFTPQVKSNIDDSNHFEINEDYKESLVLSQKERTFLINQKSVLCENEFDYAILKIYDLLEKIIDTKYQNKKLLEKYIEHVNYIRKLKNQIKELNNSVNEIKSKARVHTRKIRAIHECNGKPLLMSSEKFIKQKQPEIEKHQEEIIKLKKEAIKLQEQIEKLQTTIETDFFVLDEKNDSVFITLKDAFDSFKASKSITGKINIKDCSVDDYQKNLDLQYILCDINPICIKLNDKRFYIFPDSIWEFEEKSKLSNIYTTKVLSAIFEFDEIKYNSYLDKNKIKEDTKFITKKIQYNTFLNTYVDQEEKFYFKCWFKLYLCENFLLFKVSSYDHCECLKKAIDKYSNHDID